MWFYVELLCVVLCLVNAVCGFMLSYTCVCRYVELLLYVL